MLVNVAALSFRGLRPIAGSLAFLLVLSTAPAYSVQHAGVRVETFNLSPDGRVQIQNARGSTNVSVWSDSTVRVIAEKRGGSALAPSELVLMSMGNTVIIESRTGIGQGRIDLTVTVPARSHLQVTGAGYPVEVVGFVSSAVVETTSGSIGYGLPPNADASVSAHTARGVVRSTMSLDGAASSSPRSVVGRVGNGTSPIILASQSGNITVSPGPETPLIGRTINPPPTGSREPDAANGKERRQRESDDRDSISAAGVEDDDPASIASTPDQRPRGQSGSRSGTGGQVVFSQDDRQVENTTQNRAGPFSRTRQETETSSGSAGIGVRIIPSTSSPGARSEKPDPVYGRARDYDPPPGHSSPDAPRGTDRARDDREDHDAITTDSAPTAPVRPPVLKRPGEADTAASGGDANSGGERDEDVIVLKSALVNLNVTVTDRSGVALPGLQKGDFSIFENNVAQEVEFFSPSTAPFNLVLLLDLSGSIKDKLSLIKSSAQKYIDVLGPQDRVAVVTFTHEVTVISQLTNDRSLLKKRIRAIKEPDGGTCFYEAMWFALEHTLRGTEGQRNAIVVMSDGVDSSLDRVYPYPTRVSYGQLARRLEESDVMVFPIYLDTEFEEVFVRGRASSESYVIARDQLLELAALTGGQVFEARQARDLSGAYSAVAAALRTVYSIGYYPTNSERDGSYRRVRVNIDRSDAAVRTRRGYYAR